SDYILSRNDLGAVSVDALPGLPLRGNGLGQFRLTLLLLCQSFLRAFGENDATDLGRLLLDVGRCVPQLPLDVADLAGEETGQFLASPLCGLDFRGAELALCELAIDLGQLA